jgi:hypothetical protein
VIVKSLVFVIIGAAMSVFTPASGQSVPPGPAKFKGVAIFALDREKQLVTKATVVIEGAGKKLNLETDDNGEINVELPAGEYKLTVEAPGFKRLILTDFCMTGGARITYEFRMEIRDCDDCYLVAPENPKPVPPTAPPNNSLNRSGMSPDVIVNSNAFR